MRRKPTKEQIARARQEIKLYGVVEVEAGSVQLFYAGDVFRLQRFENRWGLNGNRFEFASKPRYVDDAHYFAMLDIAHEEYHAERDRQAEAKRASMKLVKPKQLDLFKTA